ncbi:MAG TPA: non-homologous end-joining DNA ligase [Pirellulales bacterium]|nr:non-homologous end-joining DNA ligase [Pirellulales bacterium]
MKKTMALRTKSKPSAREKRAGLPEIPAGATELDVQVSQERKVHLTNLQKPFWPKLGITKGGLLRYYTAISPVLLPHLISRAMVMKRYPNGAAGEFFFMKRAPSPRPPWIDVCSITHASGNVIEFPVVADLATLLWIVNLGCIDLNPWYARCDDVDRPDFLHFDLDPVPGATFDQVRAVALLVRDALAEMKMPSYAKTSGSKGMHVYVPIERGPRQKEEVWSFAKQFALGMESLHPELITAEYRIAKRPRGRVLVDYNQNAWGRTLASVYSVRPKDRATVSAPISWEEVEQGVEIDDFRLDNMLERIAEVDDLWKPLLGRRRVRLEKWL